MTLEITDVEAFTIPLKNVCVKQKLAGYFGSLLPSLWYEFRAVQVWFVMERTSKTMAIPSHHNRVRYHSVLVVLSVSQKPNKSS